MLIQTATQFKYFKDKFVYSLDKLQFYFSFEPEESTYFRLHAILARYNFNLGVPKLIVGFEMGVKQHVNLDGFYFQRYFFRRFFNRLGNLTYMSYLITESFISFNFLNWFLRKNQSKNSGFYSDFLEYFTIFYDDLCFKNLLNYNFEYSDGYKDLLLISNRFFFGIRFSGRFVDYIISHFCGNYMTFAPKASTIFSYVLNFATTYVVLNIGLDYTYSFFLSDYDNTAAYTIDTFFYVLWHYSMKLIVIDYFLSSFYSYNYTEKYYLNIVYHLQNSNNLFFSKNINKNFNIVFLTKILVAFPTLLHHFVKKYNKSHYVYLQRFFFYKYNYTNYIYFCFKKYNYKRTLSHALKFLFISFQKKHKSFFFFNFFSNIGSAHYFIFTNNNFIDAWHNAYVIYNFKSHLKLYSKRFFHSNYKSTKFINFFKFNFYSKLLYKMQATHEIYNSEITYTDPPANTLVMTTRYFTTPPRKSWRAMRFDFSFLKIIREYSRQLMPFFVELMQKNFIHLFSVGSWNHYLLYYVSILRNFFLIYNLKMILKLKKIYSNFNNYVLYKYKA